VLVDDGAITAEALIEGDPVVWEAQTAPRCGADAYTVWSTDASGHYISNLIGATSGTTAALESFETIFDQDLNGDGSSPPQPAC
jgi:serralysin